MDREVGVCDVAAALIGQDGRIGKRETLWVFIPLLFFKDLVVDAAPINPRGRSCFHAIRTETMFY